MIAPSPLARLETDVEIRLAPFVEPDLGGAEHADDVVVTVVARRVARELDIVAGASAIEAIELDWQGPPRRLTLVAVVPGRELDRVSSPALEAQLERSLGFPLAVEMAPGPPTPAHLEPDLHPQLAAARALLRLLTRARARERGAELAQHDEEVHQLRVGFRRMRGAARMLRRAFPDEIQPRFERAMEVPRLAMRRAGQVRDLDVLLDDLRWTEKRGVIADEQLREARDVLKHRREQALRPMRRYLTSKSYRAGIRKLEQLLVSLAVAEPGSRKTADAFSRRRLRKETARFHAVADTLDVRVAEQAHALRIAAKRLRYCAELVTDVVGRGERLGRAAAEVQSVLGRERDATRALAFLSELTEARRVRPTAALVAASAGLAMRRMDAMASARWALAALKDTLE